MREVLHYPHIAKKFNPSKADMEEFIGMIIEHAYITKTPAISTV